MTGQVFSLRMSTRLNYRCFRLTQLMHERKTNRSLIYYRLRLVREICRVFKTPARRFLLPFRLRHRLYSSSLTTGGSGKGTGTASARQSHTSSDGR